MSRHETKGTDPKHHIVIGWDPPLMTYFGQVHDTSAPDPDNDPVCWVGAGPPQLHTVDALEAAMQPYLKIGPELRAALEQDKAFDR